MWAKSQICGLVLMLFTLFSAGSVSASGPEPASVPSSVPASVPVDVAELKRVASQELPVFLGHPPLRLSSRGEAILRAGAKDLALLLTLMPALSSDLLAIQELATHNRDLLLSKFEVYGAIDVSTLDEVQRVLVTPEFQALQTAQILRQGRQQDWPILRIDDWKWVGQFVPELSRRAEVRSDGLIGRASLWLATDMGWVRFAGVRKVSANTSFYHWNQDYYADRWQRDGGVSGAEMVWRFLFAAKTKGVGGELFANNAGGGIYVSLHPTDSQSYGPVQTEFQATRDLLIVEPPPQMSDAQWTDFWLSPANRMAALNAGVSGIQTTTSTTWFNMIAPDSLRKIAPENHLAWTRKRCPAIFK